MYGLTSASVRTNERQPTAIMPPLNDVLTFITSNAGYHDVGDFLLDLIRSGTRRHMELVNQFIETRLDTVISELIVRRTHRKRMVVLEAFNKWSDAIFIFEISAIQSDPDCRLGARSLSPDQVGKFTFPALAMAYRKRAPRFFELLCRMINVLPADTAKFFSDVLGDNSEDETESQRQSRFKTLVVTIAIGIIAFGRARNCNTLQSIIGFYLFSTRTGKRTVAVLNRLGLSISYTTILDALDNNRKRVQQLLVERAATQPLFVTYDNMTNHNKVTGETLFNKSVMYCFTTAAIMFIRMPRSLAIRTGVNIAQLQAHNGILPDKKLPQETGQEYRVRKNIRTSTRGVPPQPGFGDRSTAIKASLLFKQNPDWKALKPTDLIDAKYISDDYWPNIAKGLIGKAVAKFFRAEATECLEQHGIAPKPVPVLFKIPATQSDVQTLVTMQLDESTVDGNYKVMTNIVCNQLGLTFEELSDKAIIISGDQMTVGRVQTCQDYRVRDEDDHMFRWAKPVPGFLHLRMALIHMIYLSNMGRKDGKEPGSMSRFIKLLSRTKVTAKCPDLNAAHDLLMQVGLGHILAALARLAGVTTIEQLGTKVSDGSWVGLIERLVDEMLSLDHVDKMRNEATEAGNTRYEQSERASAAAAAASAAAITSAVAAALLPAGGSQDTAAQRTASARAARAQSKKAAQKLRLQEQMRDRDIAHENALLLLTQFLIYLDGHSALRSGDSGRFEKHLDIVGVQFQGMPQLKNYRASTMDFNATRAIEWTPEMRELWLSNCFVNLAGKPNKFIAIDEFNEWVVRAIKRVYNPMGSIRSTKFTCERISPNVVSMRTSYRGVLKSSGAPDYGYKHSHVQDRHDVTAIFNLLVKEKVFTKTPGRISVVAPVDDETDDDLSDAETDTLALVPSTDTFMKGITALFSGEPVAKYVEGRELGLGGAVAADFTDPDAAETDDRISGNSGIFSRDVEFGFEPLVDDDGDDYDTRIEIEDFL